MTPQKVNATFEKHLKSSLKINVISNLNKIKENTNNHRMGLNEISQDAILNLNENQKKQFFDKLKTQTKNPILSNWRNLMVVNNTWDVLWFINVQWNFNYYPAMLEWNWGNLDIIKSNAMLKAIIKDSKKVENNKIKIITDWTFRTTKILKYNKNTYWNLKSTYISTVWDIWNRIEKPKMFSFMLWGQTLSIKIYWIYNIDDGEMVYIKNWDKVITNKYKSNIPILKDWTTKTNSNTTPQKKTTPQREECSPFVDKNFIDTLKNKYNLTFQQDKTNKDEYWLVKDKNYENIEWKAFTLDNNIDTNDKNNISDFRWSCAFPKIDIKTNWKEKLTCNYLKNKSQAQIEQILKNETPIASPDIYKIYW